MSYLDRILSEPTAPTSGCVEVTLSGGPLAAARSAIKRHLCVIRRQYPEGNAPPNVKARVRNLRRALEQLDGGQWSVEWMEDQR